VPSGSRATTKVIPSAARFLVSLTRSLNVVCEKVTSRKNPVRRANRGTWRIPSAAFANRMSKAAREVEIDASLSLSHSPPGWPSNGQTNGIRDRSEQDVSAPDQVRHGLRSARREITI
jgi:hypothetical protein